MLVSNSTITYVVPVHDNNVSRVGMVDKLVSRYLRQTIGAKHFLVLRHVKRVLPHHLWLQQVPAHNPHDNKQKLDLLLFSTEKTLTGTKLFPLVASV